jgi:hypothetical protein
MGATARTAEVASCPYDRNLLLDNPRFCGAGRAFDDRLETASTGRNKRAGHGVRSLALGTAASDPRVGPALPVPVAGWGLRTAREISQ